jgi:undecaprenyl-diphosphatase
MSDTSLFLWINHLSGHVRFIDEFFKGFSNDYFAMVIGMLLMIWLWFCYADPDVRERSQRTVIITMISIGMAASAMAIINATQHSNPQFVVSGNFTFSSWQYVRLRPFDVLPPDQINVVYYRPLDSSFPANYAAIIFSIAFPVLIRNWRYGVGLLALAVVGSFGRIYMGVHYPLDVLGGMGVGLLGCGVAFLLYWVFGWLIKILLWVFRFLAIS